MSRIKFVCPRCRGEVLCSVQTVYETIHITDLDTHNNSDWLVVGDVLETDVVDVLGYECELCGYGIGNSEITAIEWLKTNDMLEKS